MLYSMTGFSSADAESQDHRIKVEIRTLNSKFLDLNLKLPRELMERELEIKSLLGLHLKRGKINLSIELIPLDTGEPTVNINKALFKSYYENFRQLAEEVDANPKDLFRLALHSPDVIHSDDIGDRVDWEKVHSAMLDAIGKCNQFRVQEGNALQKKLVEYTNAIRHGLVEVTRQDPQRLKQVRERLFSGMEELREKVQVDQNRFEQELIYYIEKLDISEEKVRLGRHLDYFLEVLRNGEMQGKKLGFISQEIGREINTIGAKANDAVIQRAVIQMKDELEKIKEQSMNIL